jgi:hypothetical protein
MIAALGPATSYGAEAPDAEWEARSVQLFRPNSLAGWTYGGTRGWKIEAGRLTASPGSGPLLSGFTFGDFELRFQWSTGGTADASLAVLFPEVPKGQGLSWTLKEGPGCGRLQDGGASPSAGADVSAAPSHRAAIRRQGDKLTLSVDGRRLAEVSIPGTRRFGLGVSLQGQASLSDLHAAEPAGESIFNGKDLSGWWTPGDKFAWAARDDAIAWGKDGGNYLRTEKSFGNFTFTAEYKIKKRGNSGFGIRTARNGWPSGEGMEMQIEDTPYSIPIDKHATMAIYGNFPPLARSDKSEQWNRVVIKADGRMISAWINGELVQHCNTAEHPELKHRHLAGWIGIQDHGAKIEVRNLRVLEAPPGLGLEAWNRTGPANAAATVLDRLMNSQRLAAIDNIRSGVATARASGEKEQVLAELPGPGALVRIAKTADDGRLAFTFDGEPKARLECKAGDLSRTLPRVCDDANPVLTYLGFERCLKIVLRGGRRGEYRFDYVALPPGFEVRSYSPRDSGIPPGWTSALIYRQDQHGWGVHRENDPASKAQSRPTTIRPGASERLVRLEGAGVVEWVKLQADKKVLDNQDLWLEVAVDGETSPSFAAPARFWFPSLVGQGNHPNFVLTDRGGATLRLAMPYGLGFTLFASNRGQKPIAGVGASVSYEPAKVDGAPPMRLHGTFVAGGSRSELANLSGPGRWIGVVHEEPDRGTTGIASLTLDGKAAPGGADASLRLFLGQSGEDFRTCLSGRHGRLWWRYLLLEPVEWRESFVLKAEGNRLGDRLILYYAPSSRLQPQGEPGR